MAKIAYLGIPAHGHTNPMLPVGLELVTRGHEVLFYNAVAFRTKIEAAGVTFRTYPEAMPTERQVSEALHDLIHASLLFSKMSELLTPFTLTEIARERPDLIIYDSVAMWGYIAARKLGIPHVCSFTHFVLDGSQRSIGFGAMLRFMWTALPHVPKLVRWKQRMARRYGRDTVGGLTENGDLNLVFTSQVFHPENRLIDHSFRFVGPSLNPATRDGEFPFDELGHGPVIYISLGTINHLDMGFYRAVFEAFTQYPAQFILAAGKQTDITQLGAIPTNFVVRHYVPQLAILERADAFITHGGMNSVHEGVYYGVPEVVVPHQIEQLLNGKRVAQTGAGLLLGDQYPWGRVTAAALRVALDAVLQDPSYPYHAARIGRTLKASGGYRRAVEEIETFIGVHQPHTV